MSALVLDVGALIALERDDRPMRARLLVAARSEHVVLVPSTALAQDRRLFNHRSCGARRDTRARGEMLEKNGTNGDNAEAVGGGAQP